MDDTLLEDLLEDFNMRHIFDAFNSLQNSYECFQYLNRARELTHNELKLNTPAAEIKLNL